MKILTLTSSIDALFDVIIKITLSGVESCMDSMVSKNASKPVLDTYVSEPIEELAPQTFKTIQDILHNESRADAVMLHDATYYAEAISVPIYENPTIEFDTQIGKIPYGEALLVHEARGRFFQVTWNALSGWVLRDDCADRASLVYPEFKIGQEYLIDHPHTAHVRAIIGDEFGVGRSEFPLQAGEYVLYKLWRKGIRVSWPKMTNRVPGLWHTILKGSRGVHMGVMPKTGTVMEYMLDTDVGHVAYVEAVFPDDTISISEVNFPDSGIYNERTLSKEEWKSLKPIFIQIV